MSNYNENFMQQAIEIAQNGLVNKKGGPFGALIVKNDEVIATGCNQVTSSNDPCAHAEIVAIRNACKILNTFQLTGCDIYSSCEPCPMCLGAIYWARPDTLYFASTRQDAADAGFDDSFIYDEISKVYTKRQIPTFYKKFPDAKEVFKKWIKMDNKILY